MVYFDSVVVESTSLCGVETSVGSKPEPGMSEKAGEADMDDHLLPVSSHLLPSVQVCVQISSFYKDTGLGSTLRTSFFF